MPGASNPRPGGAMQRGPAVGGNRRRPIRESYGGSGQNATQGTGNRPKTGQRGNVTLESMYGRRPALDPKKRNALSGLTGMYAAGVDKKRRSQGVK